MDGHDVILSIKNLKKTFPKDDGAMVAIENFNLDVKNGDFVCILGPSGCGKTTLLRMVAGLEPLTSGSMKVRGEEHFNGKTG